MVDKDIFEDEDRTSEENVVEISTEATFKELFTKLQKKDEEQSDKNIDIDDSIISVLDQELWDQFPSEIVNKILECRGEFYSLGEENQEMLKPENKELLAMKVVEFFGFNGYSKEDIEAFLPIVFK